MAFRASYREQILPIPSNWVHDAWIAIVLSTLAEVGLVEGSLISYRLHSHQQIGTTKKADYVWRQLSAIWKIAIDHQAYDAYVGRRISEARQAEGQYEEVLDRISQFSSQDSSVAMIRREQEHLRQIQRTMARDGAVHHSLFILRELVNLVRFIL